MDCFLSLPIDLVCTVLSHWLCGRSVVFLDSAFCNVAKRRILLETELRAPQCVLNDPCLISLHWVMQRDIRVRCLKVTGSVNTKACKDYLSQFGECVQEIFLEGCGESKLAMIVHVISSHCKNIRQLRLCKCGIDDHILELIRNFDVLEELSFDRCKSMLARKVNLLSEPPADGANFVIVKCLTFNEGKEPFLFRNVVPYVRGLEKLCCRSLPFPFSAHPSLVGLKVLHLTQNELVSILLSDDIMIQIVRNCPMIIHLHIQLYSRFSLVFSDVSGVVIARDLRYLKTLLVEDCGFTDLTLQSLAAHRADTLEILGTVDCDFITAEGYSAVLQKCHKLHTVQLSTSNIEGFNYDWNNVTHLKLKCDSSEAHTFTTIMHYCNKLQYLELSYSMYDEIDISVLFHKVPQLRVLKLRRLVRWSEPQKEVVFQKIDKQDALLREISLARPELKIEFIKSETLIDVMKLSV